jgi:hypothetical protein
MVRVGLDTPEGPPADWGLAVESTRATPSSRQRQRDAGSTASDLGETTQRIGRKLVALGRVLRLTIDETQQLASLASLAGNVIDLDLHIDFDIAADGWARVTYRQELFNMSDRPLARLPRELWFEHTSGPLDILPIDQGARRLAIQRIHDTPNLAKFACLLSPALQPGETTTIGFSCEGGQFVSDHYWRQAMPRYTRRFTISLRHRAATRLVTCTALEEHPDGSESSAADSLIWDTDGADVTITLTRDYLRPHQAITLRWEVAGATA